MNSNGRVARFGEHNSIPDRAVLGRRGRGPRIPRRISVGLEPGPRAVGSARAVIDALADRVERDTLDDIRLLVSELVTNSIRHGGRQDVRLNVDVDPGSLRVEVRDAGSGFLPRPRTPNQSHGSGWGLYLVDRLTDRWGVDCDESTRVWFEIDRTRREIAA